MADRRRKSSQATHFTPLPVFVVNCFPSGAFAIVQSGIFPRNF
jgi:hypothetical protein